MIIASLPTSSTTPIIIALEKVKSYTGKIECKISVAGNEAAPPTKNMTAISYKLIFCGAFISQKNMSNENGTANDPITINPGRAKKFWKISLEINNRKNVNANVKKTLENNHGFGHVTGISLSLGVVNEVPEMKINSASSFECFLNIFEKISFISRRTSPSSPTGTFIFPVA